MSFTVLWTVKETSKVCSVREQNLKARIEPPRSQDLQWEAGRLLGVGVVTEGLIGVPHQSEMKERREPQRPGIQGLKVCC